MNIKPAIELPGAETPATSSPSWIGYPTFPVVGVTITGSPAPIDDTTEYWATNTRWRSITKDTSDGTLLREAWGDESGTTYFTHQRRPQPGLKVPKGAPRPEDMPKLIVTKGRSTPPLAGWTPAYNRKLVAKGLLSPLSPVTIAGLSGTLYVVPQEQKSTDPGATGEKWVTDDTGSRTEIALENDTFAPLARQTSKEHNGEYGTFVQREELVSRERTADASTLRAKLSSAAKQRKIKAFKAKIAKAGKARR